MQKAESGDLKVGARAAINLIASIRFFSGLPVAFSSAFIIPNLCPVSMKNPLKPSTGFIQWKGKQV
jgi:hypothetical protein